MSARDTTRNLSEQEIDRIVIAQADDDAAWGKPIYVRQAKPASVAISADLAERARFLAQLHRKASVEEWLTHIIEERVALEEAVYSRVKQDLAAKAG